MKVPSELKDRIAVQGGRNRAGKPLFRVIWADERMTVVGGRFTERDSNGNFIREVIEERRVPKYPQALGRWVFEIWMPPEYFGTPESWEAQNTEVIDGVNIQTLGPYPHEGEYELLKVLETPKSKQFVPLTSTIADAIVASAIRSHMVPEKKKVEALRRRREQEEIEKEARMAERLEIHREKTIKENENERCNRVFSRP